MTERKIRMFYIEESMVTSKRMCHLNRDHNALPKNSLYQRAIEPSGLL